MTIPEGDQGQQEGQQAMFPAREKCSFSWQIQHNASVRAVGEAGYPPAAHGPETAAGN